MKKLIRSSLSVALAALMSVSMMAHSGDGVAEEGSSSGVSYNIGYMSEYWYRGYFNLNHQLASVLMQKWVISTLVLGGLMLIRC